MKLEKNDAWAVANEEIKTLQEIIQDANAKLQNQENELRREQDRGNELEQKIYEAQIKARFKNYPSTRQIYIPDIVDIFPRRIFSTSSRFCPRGSVNGVKSN